VNCEGKGWCEEAQEDGERAGGVYIGVEGFSRRCNFCGRGFRASSLHFLAAISSGFAYLGITHHQQQLGPPGFALESEWCATCDVIFAWGCAAPLRPHHMGDDRFRVTLMDGLGFSLDKQMNVICKVFLSRQSTLVQIAHYILSHVTNMVLVFLHTLLLGVSFCHIDRDKSHHG
jgi:hypothetical protein